MTEILVARTVGDVHVITDLPSIPEPKSGGALVPLRPNVLSRFAEAGRALVAPPTTSTRTEEVPGETARHATIACIIPAYNEEATIGDVLASLLEQTRLPDVIHVIVNNTDDNTLDVVEPYLGLHERTVKGVVFQTRVFVHDLGENPDKK